MDLSIVTAVAPQRDDFLDDAAASVRALRTRLNIQWILVWDGPARRPVVEADVVLEGRPQSGISCTRNLAIPVIDAPFVTTLDADDMLVADGALAARDALLRDANLGWVGLSRTLIDGSPTKHSFTDHRVFSEGTLAQQWQAPFLFHPNSVVLRSSLLCLIGGWPAIACNEDLGMVLQASEAMAGCMIPKVLTRYRVWDKQEVAKVSYPKLKRLAFEYIEAALTANRCKAGRAPITAPRDPGGAFGTMKAVDE